jgi:hypothetical protein
MSDGSKSQKPRAVEIEAEVRQIKTMADGTINLTLNLPEYCIPQAQVLMAWVKEHVIAVIGLDGVQNGGKG